MNVDNHDELMASLQELDATPAEAKAWTPVAQLLAQWPERNVTSADTTRLMSTLTQAMPQRSVVRQAIHSRMVRQNRLFTLLATVHTQVSILRLNFWMLSIAIFLSGVFAVLFPAEDWTTIICIRAIAPLLAFLSVASVFRGVGLQTIEWELACPPSIIQLIVARLVIILGYDVMLGLLLSLVGWAHRGDSFFVVTLTWLVPLLVVAGLTLLLSLRFPVSLSATLAYTCWLVLMFLGPVIMANLLTINGELLLGLAGLFMLVFATWRFTHQIPQHFLSVSP